VYEIFLVFLDKCIEILLRLDISAPRDSAYLRESADVCSYTLQVGDVSVQQVEFSSVPAPILTGLLRDFIASLESIAY